MNIIERIGQLLASISPGLPVYRENQKGGFKEPSFYVSAIGSRGQPELFGRQKRTHGYQVVYFPDPNKPNQDMERMEQILLDKFLVLPEFAYIRDRNFSRVDGTLTVDFNIIFWAQPVEGGLKLKTMEYHGVIAY
ncbi:phage tail terminator family protein, partial [Nocardia heshunensis]